MRCLRSSSWLPRIWLHPNIFQSEPFFMGFTKYIMDSKTKVTKIGYSWKNHHGRVPVSSAFLRLSQHTGPHLGHHSLSRRSLHGLWSIWSWGTSHRVAFENGRKWCIAHFTCVLGSWEIDFLGLALLQVTTNMFNQCQRKQRKTYKNIILQWVTFSLCDMFCKD